MQKTAILVNIPITDLAPSAGLAAIKPVFNRHGIKTEIQDLNLNLTNSVSSSLLEEIYRWCELSGNLSDNSKEFLTDWLSEQINTWPACNYIAVSIFSYHGIVFGQLFLSVLRKKFPTTEIIVGGAGISSNLNVITTNMTFGEQILKNNWSNWVIFGEGELTLDNLLNNDTTVPGINNNNPVQINDLDQLPLPDYDGFNFANYTDSRLYITGSRGCVRHCTFCDVDTIWPNFRYRSPENQVREIIEHAKKYQIKRFEFTDSLINGSVSGWIRFNELLANAKEKDKELKDISYSGQFICRDKQKQAKIMYELMHYAGVRQLTVGIESFSERIRNHMKKKFSNQAIDYHLEECARWGIPNIFLMIVGYPSETLEDHRENIQALYRYKKYSDMGTIFMMRWGTTMHIITDTPVYRDHKWEATEIQQHQNDNVWAWITSQNPSLTLVERARRRLEIHCLTYDLGYSQPNSKAELSTINNLLVKYGNTKQKKIFNITKN